MSHIGVMHLKRLKRNASDLVQEHMTSQDTNFNNFASYATGQFNHIRQDMVFHHGLTTIGINNNIGFQN